jgi:hypothetical protein
MQVTKLERHADTRAKPEVPIRGNHGLCGIDQRAAQASKQASKQVVVDGFLGAVLLDITLPSQIAGMVSSKAVQSASLLCDIHIHDTRYLHNKNKQLAMPVIVQQRQTPCSTWTLHDKPERAMSSVNTETGCCSLAIITLICTSPCAHYRRPCLGAQYAVSR